MMVGGDGFALSLADRPATFPCSAAPRSTSSMSATAASISTPPSAPAAIAARFSPPPNCQVIAIDRDQTRDRRAAPIWSRRRKAGSRWSRTGSPISTRSRATAATTRSTASCSIVGVSSMQLDRARARLLVPPRRPARHAHGRAKARAPPMWSPRPASAISPTSSSSSARSAIRAPSPAPSSRRAREAPIATTAALAKIVGSVVRVEARATSIRRPARSRRCAFSSMTNSANSPRRWRPANAFSNPAAGWWWCRSIRSRTASSSRFWPRAARRAAARATCPKSNTRRPSFRALTKRPVVADEDENAAQSARPLGQAARRRTHRRAARTPAISSDLLPHLPSLADVLRGR